VRAVPLPDNDDLLREILLRLPPLPSSLPRASLVCKRWRRLVADPFFLRRFREHHHRTPPPLLGYFFSDPRGPVFVPTLAPPDCIPPERFSLPRQPGAAGERLFFLGCRHGLALLVDRARSEAVVWNPITGSQCRVPFPPEFNKRHVYYKGAVLSSSGDGHVHGDCRLIPFKLVLVHHTDLHDTLASACLYESESGKWGNISSVAIPWSRLHQPAVLVGNRLYWILLGTSDILEFDLDGQSLAMIQKPEDPRVTNNSGIQALRVEGNKLGLATLSKLSIQLWQRETNSDAAGRWVPWKTIELDKLLPLSRLMRIWPTTILGFDEDSNAFFICTSVGIYMIQLESTQFTKLFEGDSFTAYYPYTSLYTAGKFIFMLHK